MSSKVQDPEHILCLVVSSTECTCCQTRPTNTHFCTEPQRTCSFLETYICKTWIWKHPSSHPSIPRVLPLILHVLHCLGNTFVVWPWFCDFALFYNILILNIYSSSHIFLLLALPVLSVATFSSYLDLLLDMLSTLWTLEKKLLQNFPADCTYMRLEATQWKKSLNSKHVNCRM